MPYIFNKCLNEWFLRIEVLLQCEDVVHAAPLVVCYRWYIWACKNHVLCRCSVLFLSCLCKGDMPLCVFAHLWLCAQCTLSNHFRTTLVEFIPNRLPLLQDSLNSLCLFLELWIRMIIRKGHPLGLPMCVLFAVQELGCFGEWPYRTASSAFLLDSHSCYWHWVHS